MSNGRCLDGTGDKSEVNEHASVYLRYCWQAFCKWLARLYEIPSYPQDDSFTANLMYVSFLHAYKLGRECVMRLVRLACVARRGRQEGEGNGRRGRGDGEGERGWKDGPLPRLRLERRIRQILKWLAWNIPHFLVLNCVIEVIILSLKISYFRGRDDFHCCTATVEQIK